jgi:UDP-glucose 4-epimerase
VYIDDLIAGTIVAATRAPRGFQVYNIGSHDTLLVDHIAKAVIRAMGLRGVKIVHKAAPGGRGWKGDVKVMHLDLDRIRALGFRPRSSSREAVERTARAVVAERVGEGLIRK